MWRSRYITLVGRCLVLKNFGYSQLRFLLNVMSIPNETLKTIIANAHNFFWNGSSRGKVKRLALISNIEDGGIRFPDLDSIIKSQHIMWMKRYLYSSYHPWKDVFMWQINNLGGKHIVEHTSLDQESVKNANLLPYYKQLFITWAEWNKKEIDNTNIEN